MRYFIGFIGFVLGTLLIIYRERFKRVIGDLPFAEKWFGPGGTYTFLALAGIILGIGSIMFAFGTLQALIKALLGPLFLGRQE